MSQSNIYIKQQNFTTISKSYSLFSRISSRLFPASSQSSPPSDSAKVSAQSRISPCGSERKRLAEVSDLQSDLWGAGLVRRRRDDEFHSPSWRKLPRNFLLHPSRQDLEYLKKTSNTWVCNWYLKNVVLFLQPIR